jgi:DNA-directed RNA polymerase II subunit RPB2
MVRHHLESYNYFIKYGLDQIIHYYCPYKFLSENKNTAITQVNAKIKFFEHEINFSNIKVPKPKISLGAKKPKPVMPYDCRMRNLTYQTEILATVKHTMRPLDANKEPIGTDVTETIIDQHKIGSIPVMLHSCVCSLEGHDDYKLRKFFKEDPHDLGGYFIINGGEKILISQEKKISNHVTLFKNPKKSYPYVCEIKSTRQDNYGAPTTATVMMNKKNQIFFRLNPGFAPTLDIPVFVIFKSLGITDDLSILQYILYDSKDYTLINLIKPSMYQKLKDPTGEKEGDYIIETQDEALLYVAHKIRQTKQSLFIQRGIKKDDKTGHIRYLLNIYRKHLFSHLKAQDDHRTKAYFLGYMCHKLLLGRTGYIDVDDRDNYALKRLDTAGVLLSQLFYQSFSMFLNRMKDNIKREASNKNFKVTEVESMILNSIPSNEIESKQKKAFSTGEWSVARAPGGSAKQGVAQQMKRLTNLESISELRRIVTPQTANQGAKPEIRRLHPTHWGRVGCVETPEGSNIGMVKNLAILTRISTSVSPKIILEFVKDLDYIIKIQDTVPELISGLTKIFINGDWIGCTDQPHKLMTLLKEFRRKSVIPLSTGIVRDFNINEIRVYTDAGRCLRPLYIVDSGNKLRIDDSVISKIKKGELQWSDLITKGYIEYISVQEEYHNCLVATYPTDLVDPDKKLFRYTHCEIHPISILGSIASLMPYADHNQGPRDLYYCAQAKQALGIYAKNYRYRMDTAGHILWYPERPLVSTCMSKLIKYNTSPTGQNVMVAIMSFTGFEIDWTQSQCKLSASLCVAGDIPKLREYPELT